MKRIVLLLTFVISSLQAQKAVTIPQNDTQKLPEEDVLTMDDQMKLYYQSGNDIGISLRTVIGYQKSVYASLGIARTICNTPQCGFGFFHSSHYATINWYNTPGNDVYGIAIGAEYTYTGLTLGLEGVYQSNFKTDEYDIAFTPKIGIGGCNVTIFYGYTFSTQNYPFQGIGRHSVSLVIHLRNLLRLLK